MLAALPLAALLWWQLDGWPSASAGGATVTIQVGDIFFCDEHHEQVPCETKVTAGDTVVWDFTSAELPHTTTDCGATCPPADLDYTPLWDSDIIRPSDPVRTFQYTFTQPGVYPYYCEVHPFQQGIITVNGPGGATPTPRPAPTPALRVGDVNCNDRVDAIDATLVLQLSGGLVRSLRCQQNADTNANGTVNAIDATLILQFVAGLIPRLPPNAPAPPLPGPGPIGPY
jgi:plastocyanin